ncbi:YveK family protein [Clostridium tetanomorphum]|uniref:Capsular biosynthesis protein n=1 Tax=Clostridium tetanomorphum TaxID=1553 RepID=A0A923IZK8_CLOTT|nr:Wzz/FepE/Etk N-terminal domain-containing protein [Clostridium tetanomorphum]MBC2397107.1 capsular biosynthesis protein [Clostridium tetanomorphum]NRZ99049.1 capsular polysaccharide biosynthesis protein [Clostridium tetanomorphum]
MEEEITLDLRDFFRIMRKRGKLIVLITLICTLISGVLSFFVLSPTYEAKTSIIIGKLQTEEGKINNNDVVMYQNLVKTYAEIAKLDRVTDSAIKKLGGNYTRKQLQNMITVTPQQGTQILLIKAENKDAKDAARVADAVSKSFVEESKIVYPTGGNITIMDNAKVPEKPVKPKKALNVAIAFFIGLMVSVGLAFVLEYMDSTIKTEDDVERYLGLPIVGIIPKQNMDNN